MLAYPELAAIRLGYGLSPLSPPLAGPAALVESVHDAAPDADAFSMARDHLPLRSRFSELSARNPQANEAQIKAMRDKAHSLGVRAAQIRVGRAVGDAGGFGERLVQFWADHFTVTSDGPFNMVASAAFVDEAIRPHLMGRFADLMFAAETHPRMIMYLDQITSAGPNSPAGRRRPGKVGVNENLAREMIELHSLGAGSGYAQRDVRQLALLLTGLTFRPNHDAVGIFAPNRAEPGPFTVLGKTYQRGRDLGATRAVIGDLAAHEATARHIARKLAVHFVSDTPPDALVQRLARAFQGSGGDLPTLYLVLAEAPELRDCFRQKVRQPFDYVVAALRGCGFGHQDVMALEQPDFQRLLMNGMFVMGQQWGLPRGPDGWPEDAGAWTTAQGLAGRIDWAMRMLPKLRPDLPDPRAFLQAALGDSASEALRWAVPKAESPTEGMAVILASPDFNRR
ncbi:DUF1800 domain-containing protein [Paracoccus benzoatiresistens]|uniref:DUF1800 domain-containing protein n=1 Tax=Paracoccus benzoatiresistens TaxID=2997341 RepID=A0ABT4J353_9RHOB|nr:DUF1800 domain-containing protein [Paracoccus sp. EF6]MCZ0961517.1 DUF1800 domain-containing protein [Paracoccus sp. EF6]